MPSVVFTGVAGGLHPSVAVGDIVVAEAFVQHDMDASRCSSLEVPLYDAARFDCVMRRCRRCSPLPGQPPSAAADSPGCTRVGLIASGDRSCRRQPTDPPRRVRGADHPALAVEMEGAAVAGPPPRLRHCRAALRTISDGDEDERRPGFQVSSSVAGPCAARGDRRPDAPLTNARPPPRRAAILSQPRRRKYHYRHDRAGGHQHQRTNDSPEPVSSGMN